MLGGVDLVASEQAGAAAHDVGGAGERERNVAAGRAPGLLGKVEGQAAAGEGEALQPVGFAPEVILDAQAGVRAGGGPRRRACRS
jgi:hypothetical protein